MSNRNNNYTSASDVTAYLLKGAGTFNKSADTTSADKATATKDEVRIASQQANLASATREVNAAISANTVKNSITLKRSPDEKVLEKLNANLETYRTSAIGSNVKVDALAKIVEIAEKHPTKTVLDTIFKFFQVNRKEAFLDPTNALQGIHILEKSANIRARLLYEIMRDLVSGTATKKNLSLEVVRTVFCHKKDDFANWISFRMNQYARMTKQR